MPRLIISFILFWSAISVGIYLWAHATNVAHVQIGKALLFGFITAAITLGLVASLVIFF